MSKSNHEDTIINPEIFRAFSIRGIADVDLKDGAVHRIGQAIGRFFQKQAPGPIVIGRDVRTSSPRIADVVAEGIMELGLDVIRLGLVPTPVLNFATDYYAAAGGVMVTASHNPPEYNGLKIRAHTTLSEDELQHIRSLTHDNPVTAGEHGHQRIIASEISGIYLNALKDRSASLNGQSRKVVVDGNNGTNGLLVSRLLREIGYEVVDLHCEPDGTFPNGSPDPTARGATDALSHAVQREQADIGVAYDGDGDRVVVVAETGERIAGDQLLALLAGDVLSRRHEPTNIAYEILCSQAVADYVKQHGGTPIMTPSGYFYIQQAMIEHQAVLGGELSGHYFFRDPEFRFDDALLATVKTLNLLLRTDKPISTLIAELPSYHSSPEIRWPCEDSLKSTVVSAIGRYYENRYPIETIDGVRIHFPFGWALVRQSNTQPVISMRFEARDPGLMGKIQEEVQGLVQDKIDELT